MSEEQAPQSQVTTPQGTNWKKVLLTIVFILVVSGIIAGVYWYFILNKSSDNSDLTGPVPKVTTKTSTESAKKDETADWIIFDVNAVNLQFKLPPLLAEGKKLIIDTGRGYDGHPVGNLFCASLNSPSTKPVSDKILCRPSDTTKPTTSELFLIGGSSKDYTYGRDGTFLDYQGYVKKNGTYYGRFVNNKLVSIPSELVREFKNPNSLQIIIINGRTTPDTSQPEGFSPNPPTEVLADLGDGWIGALVNTKNNTSYQGFGVRMNLSDKLSEKLFEQILSTFKFLN
jgi:hypothetical protein